MAGLTVAEHFQQSERIKKSALVIQGGGMRGIYSLGALTALENHGLRDSFDLVIGSSGGAINGAYFLAGQANAALDLYVEYLSDRRFVNKRRINKIVDIDYLIDGAIKPILPVDIDTLRRSNTDFHIVLTDADTARLHVIDGKTPEFDLYELMRATAALPILYNKRIRIGDRYFVDGGIVNAVPVSRAVEYGAQEVLAILTRPRGFRRHDSGKLHRLLALQMARGLSAALRAILLREDVVFNETMDLLEGKTARDGLATFAVWPSDEQQLVGRTSFDKAKLLECAAMGRRDMQAALSEEYMAFSPITGLPVLRLGKTITTEDVRSLEDD